MASNIKAYILHVFTDKTGNFGDKASVVIDEGKQISDIKRQIITRKLDTGETIFINNLTTANISVMHSQGEIDFAGVGLLGTAWLLTKLRKKATKALYGRGGKINTWQEVEITWVRADISTMPLWHHKQLESVKAVESITLPETTNMEHTMVWAWIDENKGLIRARTFAKDWEIPEAEGNGSGAMLLANMLKRAIEIKHGKGSIIYAKPEENGLVDLGGRVEEDKPQEIVEYVNLV
ncbi:MAG TPA: PhzF family phenazine biosynthesis protein [Patescibacteria group bacterium]|nr:PhzF family phenazine biosynthesis protein [Patescibacteria group bacterium]